MSASVLLNLLNELEKEHFISFRNEFNKGHLKVVMGITVYRCLKF